MVTRIKLPGACKHCSLDGGLSVVHEDTLETFMEKYQINRDKAIELLCQAGIKIMLA